MIEAMRRVTDGGLERGEIDIPQIVEPMREGAQFCPPCEALCPTKCLPVAMTPPSARVSPCRPLDVGNAEMADEGGILAEGLLGAPPAGIAGDIEHRRQPLMRADAAQLLADFGGHLGGKFGLEGAGKPQHLRVHRAAQPHVARTAFLVDNGRDAEAGLVDEDSFAWRC